MLPAVGIPVLIIVGYLLGTVPSAVWVARSRGVDIYKVGSGNPGASNVYRAVGKGAAAAVFAIDAAKGAIPAALGRWMPGGTVALGLVGGAAAIVGHTWPVFRRFKGGRGAATGAGTLAVCFPLLALIAGAVFAVFVAIFRKPSIGTLVAIGSVGAGVFVLRRPPVETSLVALLVLLVLARHAGNIKRLIRGEELGLELEADGDGGDQAAADGGNPERQNPA